MQTKQKKTENTAIKVKSTVKKPKQKVIPSSMAAIREAQKIFQKHLSDYGQ